MFQLSMIFDGKPIPADVPSHLSDIYIRITQNTEIREQKNHELILIWDAYDETEQGVNMYRKNRTNESGQWRAQMMIRA